MYTIPECNQITSVHSDVAEPLSLMILHFSVHILWLWASLILFLVILRDLKSFIATPNGINWFISPPEGLSNEILIKK